MVGAVRFELTTSCTRNKRASQATLRPEPDAQNSRIQPRKSTAIFTPDFHPGFRGIANYPMSPRCRAINRGRVLASLPVVNLTAPG